MRWRLVLAVCVLSAATVLSGSDPAGAQGLIASSYQNWNFLGGGARSRGMGGAYLGISDDAHAGSWNPAGLVYNEGVLTAFDFELSHDGVGLDNAPLGQTTRNLSTSRGFSNLSSASFVSPFTVVGHEVILTAFYNRVQDIYARGNFRADIDPILGSPFDVSYRQSGNVAVAGASFGTVMYKQLTVGGTLNLVTGNGISAHNLDLDSTRDTSAFFQHVSWRDRSDLDYNGLFFTLGALYRAPRWSVGAVFSPNWTLEERVDFQTQRIGTHNQIPYPSPPILAPLKGTVNEIDIPYTIGLGGSYKVSERLLLAADYQLRAFGRNSFKSADSTSGYRVQLEPAEPGTPLEAQPVKWFNLHQIRLGMEYRYQTRYGLVPLRLGLRNEPMLLGDNTNAYVLLDQRLDQRTTAEFPYYRPLSDPTTTGSQVRGWTLAIGSGIQWSQVRLDLALEWTGFTYHETGSLAMIQGCSDCDPNIDPTVEVSDKWGRRKLYNWGEFTRTYESDRIRLSINFTGTF
ncbi:MAG: hypothetical protein AB1792_11285 [Candidatus Zixiibacteriota bacterium]